MPASRTLRYEVLRRDGYTCRYCGAKAPDAVLTVDHVIPVALGGTDEPANLVAACRDCNAGKSATPPDAPLVDGVTEDALRWAAAMREAAATQQSSFQKREAFIDGFDGFWDEKTGDGPTVHRPHGWRQSIGRFYDLGLQGWVLSDALETAWALDRLTNERVFSYFCGIVWRKYNERQEMARGLLETEDSG